MNDKTDKPGTPPADPGRRRFLGTSLLVMTAAATGIVPGHAARPGARRDGPRVVVVGAGAFGGWTALHLLQRGCSVKLVDAWGAGNPRASSGGETRVIRGMYGPDAVYVDWVLRSFELWRKAERDWGEQIYTPTGALWMFRSNDDYARTSLPLLARRDLRVEKLTPAQAGRRFAGIDFTGVRSVFHESRAGFLAARDACRHLARAFSAAGGDYRTARVRPGPIGDGKLKSIQLSDGSALDADAYVFACGPWLGALFPELLDDALTPTRQEVYYFGVPGGITTYDAERFPVWVDFGERVFYGIPGNDGRGFKVADDTRGEPAEPTAMDRRPGPDGVQRARRLLAERFPPLADAPLLEARVCQYTNSPDGHFVLDRHPAAENCWIAGGGSGHGFKLGPAVGEYMAQLVLGEAEPMEMFSIARLAEALEKRTQLSGES